MKRDKSIYVYMHCLIVEQSSIGIGESDYTVFYSIISAGGEDVGRTGRKKGGTLEILKGR